MLVDMVEAGEAEPWRIDELGDRVAQMVQEAGYTPEQLMATLDEERERYYAEHYAGQE